VLTLTLLVLNAAPRCLVEKPASANLPNAVLVGKRFVVTWYEPVPGGSLEQKVMLLEPEGELVGSSAREGTPSDGASSVMGRLAFNGTKLGLAWMDDGSKQRTATFRTLDATGAVSTPPVALTREFLPHGDQVAIAWNAKVEAWGAVFTGTLPTKAAGNVTHHQYFVSFRGEPGAPVRLDEGESVSVGHNLALVPKGACFLTGWATYPTALTVLGEVCDGKVRRQTVSERPGKSPMLVNVAAGGDEVLVTWVDDVPPPPAKARASNVPAPPGREADVFFALLDAKGVVRARGSLPVTGVAQSPVARFDGTKWWVVWPERRDHTEAVLAAKLTREGKVDGELLTVGTGWDGPVWVSLAASGATTNALISHPSDAPCVVSWAPLPAK
jgi:hypothetical protein